MSICSIAAASTHSSAVAVIIFVYAVLFQLNARAESKGSEAAPTKAKLQAEVEDRARDLGVEHPDTLASRHRLAHKLHSSGDHSGAYREFLSVSEIRKRTLGPNHADTLASQDGRAKLALALQKRKEAEGSFRETLAARDRILGPQHTDTLLSRRYLAIALLAQGKFREADVVYRQSDGSGRADYLEGALQAWRQFEKFKTGEEALRVIQKGLRYERPGTILFRELLISNLKALAQQAQMEASARARVAISELSSGTEASDTLSYRFNLANVLFMHRRYAESEAEHRSVLAARLAASNQYGPYIVRSRSSLAQVLHARGEYSSAELELRAVLALRDPNSKRSKYDRDVHVARFNLARALEKQGKIPEALREAEMAYSGLLSLPQRGEDEYDFHAYSMRDLIERLKVRE